GEARRPSPDRGTLKLELHRMAPRPEVEVHQVLNVVMSDGGLLTIDVQRPTREIEVAAPHERIRGCINSESLACRFNLSVEHLAGATYEAQHGLSNGGRKVGFPYWFKFSRAASDTVCRDTLRLIIRLHQVQVGLWLSVR